jgi:hypothetical protein
VGISIREADIDRDLPLLASTINTAFGSQVSEARFRWLYQDNPDGRAVAWFALDDRTGEVAGCTAVSPRRVSVAGREVRAWNCGDFSIAARYRTMGAAVKLRRAARDGIDAGHSPFLYAHPNERMLQVHLRVGHTPLARMQRHAKPLRLKTGSRIVNNLGGSLLRVYGGEAFVRLTQDVEIVQDGPLPADIENVYDAVRSRLGTAVVRDRRYLQWRFQENPAQRTETLITRSGGRPTAWLTYLISDESAVVKDWLSVNDTARDQVFAAFLREARRRRAASAAVIALETHPDLPALRRLGFVLRPDESMAVTYASEKDQMRAAVADPSRWYMTSGDRDV